MSIPSSSNVSKNGTGPNGLDGSDNQGFSYGSPTENNTQVVDAVVKIQAAARGYLVRKKIGEGKLNNFVIWFNTETRKLLSQIKKVAEKVEASWQRHFVNQKEEVEAIDKLLKIRNEIITCREMIQDVDFINKANSLEVNEFVDEKTEELTKARNDFMGVCEGVGFHSVKQGMKVLFGDYWEHTFSKSTAQRIEDFNMMFVPTSYDFYFEDGTSDIFTTNLMNASGETLAENSEYFDEETPYLTEIRGFKPSNPIDEVEGAELNIPFHDSEGNPQLLVMKGYFKRDPINVSHNLELVVRRKTEVEREFAELTDIPTSFKRAYLTQYPIRDLILKDPIEIAEELVNDYEYLNKVNEGGLLPSLILNFALSSISKQVRIFSLLLMHENPQKALFLYEMTAKQIPQYQQILRNTLHYSLQKKLDLALDEWEETKKKLKELNHNDVPYETRISLSKMGELAKKKAMEKVKQAKGHDSDKAEKYLDGLLDVPFGTFTPEPVTRDSDPKEIAEYLNKVEEDLGSSVHGHEEPKKAVLEWVAQRISNGESKGECIAFEGPPGVGKTTFAKEGIAKALNRPFAFLSLGGQTDSSFLVGHGYTYVGSNWGRIVEILQESKCMDPVIYIDEVDKISRTEKGKELIGVLTALTDFSQNKEFQDKYFSGVKFDLSRALFIFSYNDVSQLDPVFKDRLKIIKIGPQSASEKLVIARKHLLPEILQSCGFKEGDVTIDDEEIKFLIEHYTFEAGVRKLKENLFAIVRQLNLLRLKDPSSISFPYNIDRETIIRFRKEPKVEFKRIAARPGVGTVNGLYATNAGIGGLTIVQAYKTLAKERLQLTLTGSQGDVMQESMSVARSVAWNLIPDKVKEKIYQSPPEGLHVHCPEGATPKDGPSAGGAITTAIVSQLLGIPIKNDVAMTGEIDLMGNITKIGGLSAKLHGAKRAGVRLALVPRDNAKDLEEIRKKFPELVDENFEVKVVDTIYDLLDNALVHNPIKRPEGLMLLTDDPPSEKIKILDDNFDRTNPSSDGKKNMSEREEPRSTGKRTYQESIDDMAPESKRMKFEDVATINLEPVQDNVGVKRGRDYDDSFSDPSTKRQRL